MLDTLATTVVTLMAAAMLGSPVAAAEPTTIDSPDLNGIICQQQELGQSPEEIAERIGSDPRVPWPSQVVSDALQDCDKS